MSIIRITLISLLVLSAPALGQQSEKFGDLELHYSVVNTTFLSAEIAELYGITRGKQRAILNLALRKPRAGTIARGRPCNCGARFAT